MTSDSQKHFLDSIPGPQRSRLIAGMALVGLGLFLLVAQFVPAEWMGLLIFPVLAATFTAWGLLTRNFGLLVPGGVLAGIGLGTYLVTGPFAEATDPPKGGIFLLAFAAGWVFITLLSPFACGLKLWPLIPGGILALAGGLLFAGPAGLQVLEWAGRLWPLVLVIVGLGTLISIARHAPRGNS